MSKITIPETTKIICDRCGTSGNSFKEVPFKLERIHMTGEHFVEYNETQVEKNDLVFDFCSTCSQEFMNWKNVHKKNEKNSQLPEKQLKVQEEKVEEILVFKQQLLNNNIPVEKSKTLEEDKPISTRLLTFSKAIEFAKAGKKVARLFWNKNIDCEENNMIKINPEYYIFYNIASNSFYMKTKDSHLKDWIPQAIDMTTNDWIIIN